MNVEDEDRGTIKYVILSGIPNQHHRHNINLYNIQYCTNAVWRSSGGQIIVYLQLHMFSQILHNSHDATIAMKNVKNKHIGTYYR